MGKRGPQPGFKMTEDHKEKIRQAKLKYKPTIEHITAAKEGLIKYYKNHPEAILKLSAFRKTCKHTLETRRKISESMGGRRKERFYGLTKWEWTQLQRKIKERDNFTCQLCGFKGTTRNLNTHHIKPFKYSHDNSEGNLITLCLSCHGKVEHGKIGNDWEKALNNRIT